MKTKFFLLIGLLVFAGVVWDQNEDRQSKVAAKEAKVKKNGGFGTISGCNESGAPHGRTHDFSYARIHTDSC